MQSEETIDALIAHAAQRAPGKPALVTSAGAVTFGELLARAVRQARPLAGPVPIAPPNGVAFIERFLACLIAGQPAFVTGATSPLADGLCAEPDEFYWGLTSGSTGEPKIFARTHRSWLESFKACEAVFPFQEQDVVMAPGSLTHSLFLYGAVHALARGLTVILAESFAPRSALRLMQAHGASVLYAVPAMLHELLAVSDDWPPLRLIFSGGAKLSPALRERLEARLPSTEAIEFYGASETSFVTYVSTSHPAPEASVGRPFPGVAIEIRDRQGRAAPNGLPGLIHVASPMLFSRYVGGERAGEWVTAGDMGFLDKSGFLHITGRADRELNSKGRKINAESIEAVLYGHGTVNRAAVVGLADDKRGEIIAAVLEFHPGLPEPPSRSALSAYCRERLGDAFSPQLYFAAVSLPITRTGKIAFAEVKRALENGQAGYAELR